MTESKSKLTLYVRPELHKLLKLRSVQEETRMSALAEKMLERYLLEFPQDEPVVCPHCSTSFVPGTKVGAVPPKLPVGSAQ